MPLLLMMAIAPARREAAEFEAGKFGKPQRKRSSRARHNEPEKLSDVSSYTFSAGEYLIIQSHQM
jgi:hypothetical protein